MKNFITTCLLTGLTSLIIFSCTKEETKSDMLKGVWLITHIDGEQVPTDERFVMELTDDKEYYSEGIVLDSDNKKWFDRIAYDYSFSNDRIVISGTDVQNNAIQLEFAIISLNHTELICSVHLYKLNGVEIPDPKIYKYKKAVKNLQNDIIGTWYGKSTHAGSTDTDYHYWNYLPNGTYEYYYRDNPASMQWIKKNDNEGRYYVYDNLLATNWSNDIFTGLPGLDYECWEITITGNTMQWIGYRQNGRITSYEMQKVAGPPGLLENGNSTKLVE